MKNIEDALLNWGEPYEPSPTKARRVKPVRGKMVTVPAKEARKQTPKGRLKATVTKTPEVMVKISGGGKDMKSIKAHFDYISRNGDVKLEDERGEIVDGREDVRNLGIEWAGHGQVPADGGTRREAFNIVLSMPPGTDRPSVTNAARTFAAEEFADHQYVFATHEDEKHPHVHLVVKAVDRHGVRMNPRKADLQRWREGFALALRDQGILANATPRKARGVVRKPEAQVVRHINKEFAKGKRPRPAKVSIAEREIARRELAGQGAHENPARVHIDRNRKDMHRSYGDVAKALAKGGGEDKQLALQVVEFVKHVPAPVTRHQAVMATMRAKAATQSQKPLERAQDGHDKGLYRDVGSDKNSER